MLHQLSCKKFGQKDTQRSYDTFCTGTVSLALKIKGRIIILPMLRVYCDAQALPIIPISTSTLSYVPYTRYIMVVPDTTCSITPHIVSLMIMSKILLSQDEF